MQKITCLNAEPSINGVAFKINRQDEMKYNVEFDIFNGKIIMNRCVLPVELNFKSGHIKGEKACIYF